MVKYNNLKKNLADTLKETLKEARQNNTRPTGDKVFEAGDTAVFTGENGDTAIISNGDITYVGDTVPPVPGGITASGTNTVVTVTWNGTFADPTESLPDDWSHIEVWADGIRKGEIRGNARNAVPFESTAGTTHSIVAYSVDKAGNRSEGSAPVSVTVESVLGTEWGENLQAELDAAEGRITTAEGALTGTQAELDQAKIDLAADATSKANTAEANAKAEADRLATAAKDAAILAADTAAQADIEAAEARAATEAARVAKEKADQALADAKTADTAIKTVADQAQADADAAAALANSKGKTYFQPTEPVIDLNGLWVDTDNGNKPHRTTGKRALFYSYSANATLHTEFAKLGWTVDNKTDTTPSLELAKNYDLVIFDGGVHSINTVNGYPKQFFEAGISVISAGNDTNSLPGMVKTWVQRTSTERTSNPIRPVGTHALAQNWTEFIEGDMIYVPNVLETDVTVFATTLAGGADRPVGLVKETTDTKVRWIHVQATPSLTPSVFDNNLSDYQGPRWVPVQDQAIVSASEAAALAHQAALDAEANAKAEAKSLADEAQRLATEAAAADATAKDEVIGANAATEAARVAQEKADQAKTDAISAAALDATAKANEAERLAKEAAALDASTKAEQAEADAISAAALDAKAKADQALIDAKKADEAVQAIADTAKAEAAMAQATANAAVSSAKDLITDPTFLTGSDNVAYVTLKANAGTISPIDTKLPAPATSWAVANNGSVDNELKAFRYKGEVGRVYQVEIDVCPQTGTTPTHAFELGARTYNAEGTISGHPRAVDANGAALKVPTTATGWVHLRGTFTVPSYAVTFVPWLRNSGASPGWVFTNWHFRDITEAQTAIKNAATAQKRAEDAEANAKAEAKKLADAAELAAKNAAALDAQTKMETAEANAAAEASRLANQALLEAAGLVDAKGKIWFQDAAPSAGKTHRWLSTAGASVSVQEIDGVESRRNVLNGARAAALVSGTTITPNVTHDGRSDWVRIEHATGTEVRHYADLNSLVQDQPYIATFLIHNESDTDTTINIDIADRAAGTFSVPARGTTRLVSEPTFRPSTDTTPGWNSTYRFFDNGVKGGVPQLQAERNLELASTFNPDAPHFDGNTPDERENDLWIDTANGNKPHRWDRATKTWIPVQDAAIEQAKLDAIKAAELDAAKKASDAQSAAILAAADDAAAKDAQVKLDAASEATTIAQAKADQALVDAKKADEAVQAIADQAKADAALAQRTAQDAAKNASNLVVNGSFEQDLVGWSKEGSNGSIDSTTAYDGTKSFYVPTTGAGILQPGFPVTEGQTYRYGFRYKTIAGYATGNAGGLRLQTSKDGGATFVNSLNTSLTETLDWTHHEAEYIVPAGVTHVRARLAFASSSTMGVWIDAVSLVDVTTIKALEKAASDANQRAIDAEANAKAEAKTLADEAQRLATEAASLDATEKSSAAQTAAINQAALDSEKVAETKKQEAISAAATDASTKAQAAQDAAIEADKDIIALANGKNSITNSTVDPNAVGKAVGDVWFKRGTNGIIIGQWEWTGGTTTAGWAKRTIDNAVIANLDAGKINAGTINAARIGANSISAEKLVVGDFTNLWADVDFLTGSNGIGAPYTGTEVVPNNHKAVQVSTRDHIGHRKVMLQPGQSFRLTWTQKLVAGARELRGSMWLTNQAGTKGANWSQWSLNSATYMNSPKTLIQDYGNGWVRYTVGYTIPTTWTDVYYGQVYFQMDQYSSTPYDTSYLISDIEWRRMDGGSLIVDGAITSTKIKSDEIEAKHLKTDAVTADKIQADAVTSTKIAANAVTAEKIVVTDTLSANIVNSMTAQTKNLVVTEDAILNRTTVIGGIAADEINAATIKTTQLVAGEGTMDSLAAGQVSSAIVQAGIKTSEGTVNGVTLDASGLTAKDGSGATTVRIGTDGSASFTGAVTVTGGSVPASTVSGTLATTNVPTLPADKVSGLTATKITNYDTASTRITDWTASGATTINGAKIAGSTVAGTQINATSVGSELVAKSAIQTTTTAARGVKITPTGITAYDGTGAETVKISSDGSAFFKGTIQAGSTVPAGAISGTLAEGNVPTLAQSKVTGLTDLNTTVGGHTTSIGNLDSSVSTLSGTVNDHDAKLAEWASANDTTLIDGAKIYTGSITADKVSLGSTVNMLHGGYGEDTTGWTGWTMRPVQPGDVEHIPTGVEQFYALKNKEQGFSPKFDIAGTTKYSIALAYKTSAVGQNHSLVIDFYDIADVRLGGGEWIFPVMNQAGVWYNGGIRDMAPPAGAVKARIGVLLNTSVATPPVDAYVDYAAFRFTTGAETKLTASGLTGYNGGVETMRLNGDSNMFIGDVLTGRPGQDPYMKMSSNGNVAAMDFFGAPDGAKQHAGFWWVDGDSATNLSGSLNLYAIDDSSGSSDYKAGIVLSGDGNTKLNSDAATDIIAGTTATLDAKGGNAAVRGSGRVYLEPTSGGLIIKNQDSTGYKFAGSGTAALYLDSSGVLWKTGSSVRYKTNIEDFQIDPAKVLDLRPRKWNPKPNDYSETDPKTYYGFIAEEVEQVIPELVSYEPDPETGEMRPESLNYDRFTTVLVMKAKEQEARIQALEAQVAELLSK